MFNLSLREFTQQVVETKRISFGDVNRLKRSILPDGIAGREEVELLIGIDRAIGRADPAWSPWLVAAIVDFVVWGDRPTGYVDEAAARWLAAALEGSPRTARLIVSEILREAQAVDPLLAALAQAHPKRRHKAAAQIAPEHLAA
jgi:hypothetical protein